MPDERPSDSSLDIVGIGKAAEAIPDKVYEQAANTLAQTFAQLTAPITESTAGLGRYLKQKFDNMVEAERAIATYTIEKAIARAKARAEARGQRIQPPESAKTFVRSIEEASKETDPTLHEMWANLIASQLIERTAHPHFVEILTHFSSTEARLLEDILPWDRIGPNGGGLISVGEISFRNWARRAGAPPQPWSISCAILFDFGLISALVAPGVPTEQLVLLYRTQLGTAFMQCVNPEPKQAIP